MLTQPPHFEIDDFFAHQAREILLSYDISKSVHYTKNIRAAGDKVENTVRSTIAKNIPNSYYVGQGHIVDSSLKLSGQIDILIADNKGSPILFSSDGTDYLAYESVYAIGEVKSSFKPEHIDEFVSKAERINIELTREKASVFQVSQDFALPRNNFKDERTEEGWAYKNPLFKFMFFVNSEKVNIEALLNKLQSLDGLNVPNLIILLDRGIIVNGKTEISHIDPIIERTEEDILKRIQFNNIIGVNGVRLYPEFSSKVLTDTHNWCLIEFQKHVAANLAYLVYTLNYHLNRCIVLSSDLIKYHQGLFHTKSLKLSEISSEQHLSMLQAHTDRVESKLNNKE